MSRRSLKAWEKRLRNLESRQGRDVGRIAVVDLLAWGEADRLAYDAGKGWEVQAAIVERVQGERPVRHADNRVVLLEIRPASEPSDAR